MGYKHNHHLDQIARELGAQYIVEGSLRGSASQLRIAVQVIRVNDQSELWSRVYDNNAEDILRLQSQVAGVVADAIQLKLTPQRRTLLGNAQKLSADALNVRLDDHAKERPAEDYTQRVEARQLYFKGRYFWNRRNAPGFQKAIDFFRQALDKDPDYALAYSGLADCYLLIGGYGIAPQKEMLPVAIAAARKALEIDPDLAEAHTSLALIAQNYEWDWPKANREYRRALAGNPNYVTAHHWYGEFLGLMGRFDQGLQELERARQLDPLSTIIGTDTCKILYHARRYDQAIEQCRKTLNMDPRFVPAWQWLGVAYRRKGMLAEAVAVVEKAAQLDPNPITLIEADIYRAMARSRSEGLVQVGRMKDLWKQGSVAAYQIAMQYAWFGEKDLAFEWLEKATAERTPWVVGFTIIPHVDLIRSDPRFDALVRRLGLNRVSIEQ